jgi:hypothetical protein
MADRETTKDIANKLSAMDSPNKLSAVDSPNQIDFQHKWDDCGLEEKIERLRRALRDYRWSYAHMMKRTQQFENHKHDLSGEIVVSLHTRGGEGEASMFDVLA